MPRWLQAALIAAVAAAVALPAGAFAAQTLGVGQFDDVHDDDTHAEAIGWLADAGVTAGCTPDEYCPADSVTRAQMATFMRRLAGGDGSVDPVVDAASVGGMTADEILDAHGVTVTTLPAPSWISSLDEPNLVTRFWAPTGGITFEYHEDSVAAQHYVAASAQVPTWRHGEPQYLHAAVICARTSPGVDLEQVSLGVYDQPSAGGFAEYVMRVVADSQDFDGVHDGVDVDRCFQLSVDLDPADDDVTQGFELDHLQGIELYVRALTLESGGALQVRHGELRTSSQGLLPTLDLGATEPSDPVVPVLGSAADQELSPQGESIDGLER